MELNRKQLFSGVVVKVNGLYYFSSRKGHLYNLPQTEEVKQLCNNGKLCVFELVTGRNDQFLYGKIVEVMGNSGDPIPEGKAIAKSYDLIREPSQKVMDEVASIPQEVSGDQIKNIADLRDVPFVTIDPDTAKDFDDAVYACKNPDGTYTLKVAIANVASYIKPGSALFQYALEAGNSSYLGNTCYPMLVEELSNGICSLNEKVDRLAFCTTCTIRPNGQLVNYKIEPAVINSNHRLTYKEADYLYFGENHTGDTLDHSAKKEETLDVLDSLSCLYDVANILYKARMKRGAFDIDSKKLSFKLDESGTKVLKYEKDHDEVFTSVIEETAILTNEIWGEVSERFKLPFFYRNHRQIDNEKISDLRHKLSQFDIKLPKSVRSQDLQKIIDNVRGKRIEEYVVSTILKAMESAYYDVENLGHAGLAIVHNNFKSFKQMTSDRVQTISSVIDDARRAYFLETGRSNGLCFDGDITHCAYAQTTSPIRRGSDLVNQMQMQEFINNGSKLYKTYDLIEYSEKLNFFERNSAKAEIEYDDMLSAKWGMDNIGKVFLNCIVVSLGENAAKVVTPDGYRMSLPYGEGVKKKYLKIGTRLARVSIDSASLCPPRVICKRDLNMKKESEAEENIR